MKDEFDISILKPETRYNQLIVHQRLAISTRGQYAMDMCRTMAMVTEPLAGSEALRHQPVRLLSPQEAVTRSFAITDLLFDELERRGLVKQSPSWNELIDDDARKAGF